MNKLEMFYLNSTLNFGVPTVLVFQLEVYYMVDRLLTGLTAQQKGTTAWLYSNKTSLLSYTDKSLLIQLYILSNCYAKIFYINNKKVHNQEGTNSKWFYWLTV